MNIYHKSIAPTQERAHADWIDEAREVAKALARKHGKISSDDIWDHTPPPPGADPRVMGAVFRPRKDWKPVGYVPSRRSTCHSRPVREWSYVGD